MGSLPEPPPELRRGVGQGLGSAGDDAILDRNDPGQRVLALPADLGPLDRGTPPGPGFVQALEVEQAFGEALFENGEGLRRRWAWGRIKANTKLLSPPLTPEKGERARKPDPFVS